MPKDACYRKVKAKFKVFPSAYAGGAIAKCRKVGAANYGNAKKKAEGGVVELKNGGNVTKQKRKRPTKNKNIARGCGIVMSNRRKVTKYR
mgnify:CR=1|jgi:hypothetical protein|tara:strand:- start:229 stop:498 length:270 start_codon:yes stop_codon:yes gene_type:complete